MDPGYSSLTGLTLLRLGVAAHAISPEPASGFVCALDALNGLQRLDTSSASALPLAPGPWQGQLTSLQASWEQLGVTAEVAGAALLGASELRELVLLAGRRQVPGAAARAALASLAALPKLRILCFSTRGVEWADGALGTGTAGAAAAEAASRPPTSSDSAAERAALAVEQEVRCSLPGVRIAVFANCYDYLESQETEDEWDVVSKPPPSLVEADDDWSEDDV